MRLLSIAVLVLLSSNAMAEDYFCHESRSSAIAAKRSQYGLWIKELSDLPADQVPEDYDYAKNVSVTLLSRDPNSRQKFSQVRKFTTIATLADVMYQFSSRRNGLSGTIYLDELDQTSVEIKGVKGSIQMECRVADHN